MITITEKLYLCIYIASIIGCYNAIRQDLLKTKRSAGFFEFALCVCPFLNTLIWIVNVNYFWGKFWNYIFRIKG